MSEKIPQSFKIFWRIPRKSQKAPKFFTRFQRLPRNPGEFRDILVSIGGFCKFQRDFKSSEVLWKVPRDFTELQEILESSEIFQGVLGGFKVFLRVYIELRKIPESSEICWKILKDSIVSQEISQSFKIFWRIPRKFQKAPKCFKRFQRLSRNPGEFQDILVNIGGFCKF